MNNGYSECIAEIGSMTQAMRAQKVLSEEFIPVTVVKTDSSKSEKGCAYGVSFPCAHFENAENIFKKSRVRVRRWKKET